jgi:hypothetical protein
MPLWEVTRCTLVSVYSNGQRCIMHLWEVTRCAVVSVYSNGQRCIPEGTDISTVRHKN